MLLELLPRLWTLTDLPSKPRNSRYTRVHTLSAIYGLKNLAEKLYKGLEVGIENCTKCSECVPKCQYKLPIISMLQKAQMDLYSTSFQNTSSQLCGRRMETEKTTSSKCVESCVFSSLDKW